MRSALAIGAVLLLLAGAASAAPAPVAPASGEVQAMTTWIAASGDNHGLPFVVVDKVAARVFVFTPSGALKGATPALLGLARGDVSTPGIGDRPLATIGPEERTTPAGRFVAARGRNLADHDILWIDYADAISLHPVVTNNPAEHRLQRLATPSASDNRISYGCINVPEAFYRTVIVPAFTGTSGVVYILPEVRPLADVFVGMSVPAP